MTVPRRTLKDPAVDGDEAIHQATREAEAAAEGVLAAAKALVAEAMAAEVAVNSSRSRSSATSVTRRGTRLVSALRRSGPAMMEMEPSGRRLT
jgi:hypothetical protein